VSNLLAKDSLNINFYKSNNGIQLILKFTSLIHRNIEKGFLKISIEESINSFTISVNKNKVALQKKYGKGGFNSLSNLIFSDIKSNNISFINMEFEIKKLI
jgi:hypothetical protein